MIIRTIIIVVALLVGAYALGRGTSGGGEMPPLRDGDIIFHTSRSSQSEAIQIATDSPYTHMGVIVVDDGEPLVYEAIGPVTRTPLDEWIARGVDGKFVVKRLSDVDRRLTEDAIAKLEAAGLAYRGKRYDHCFAWTDDELYCSELVWKMYESALGIRIGEPQRFRDLDTTDPAVVEEMRKCPGGIAPDELVISPARMFESERLVKVYER